MPFYDYFCENEDCGHSFETVAWFSTTVSPPGPECGKESLVRPINLPVISAPKTLGSLADKNSSRMSTAEMQEHAAQAKKKKDTLSKNTQARTVPQE